MISLPGAQGALLEVGGKKLWSNITGIIGGKYALLFIYYVQSAQTTSVI